MLLGCKHIFRIPGRSEKANPIYMRLAVGPSLWQQNPAKPNKHWNRIDQCVKCGNSRSEWIRSRRHRFYTNTSSAYRRILLLLKETGCPHKWSMHSRHFKPQFKPANTCEWAIMLHYICFLKMSIYWFLWRSVSSCLRNLPGLTLARLYIKFSVSGWIFPEYSRFLPKVHKYADQDYRRLCFELGNKCEWMVCIFPD